MMFAEKPEEPRLTPEDARKRRAEWIAALVTASEALTADLDQNPAGVPFSENAKALIRRAQTTAEDLLREAAASGWLTDDQAADALFTARHGRPAEERKKRSRIPR